MSVRVCFSSSVSWARGRCDRDGGTEREAADPNVPASSIVHLAKGRHAPPVFDGLDVSKKLSSSDPGVGNIKKGLL